jgi:hypothetical protein
LKAQTSVVSIIFFFGHEIRVAALIFAVFCFIYKNYALGELRRRNHSRTLLLAQEVHQHHQDQQGFYLWKENRIEAPFVLLCQQNVSIIHTVL